MGCKNCEVSFLLTGNDEIRVLNRQYRGKDKPTDVLSFPMNDEYLLGDIVISMEKAGEQAAEFGVSKDEEVCRLIAHGLLHLLGYDHVKGGTQAKKMKAKEDGLMVLLKEKGFC